MNKKSSFRQRPLLIWALLLTLLVILVVLALVWLRQSPAGVSQNADYYNQNQILLSGPRTKVAQVIAEAGRILGQGEATSVQDPISEASLDPLSGLDVDCSLLTTLQQQGGYVVAQYQFSDAVSQKEITEAIQQARQSLGFTDVVQELNWRTGSPPEQLSGSPWGPEGSPWGPEGSPWGPEGSPWGPEGSPWGPEGSPWGQANSPTGQQVLAVAGKAFRQQWAFNQNAGVHSRLAQNPGDSANRAAGQNVVVGVFDTSPFPAPMTQASFVMAPGEPPWTLDLVHPMAGGRAPENKDKVGVPNHGLFAAGLVNAVAPGSRIELIRVLDDTGHGDLQTLNRALVDFILRVGSANQGNEQTGIATAGVINLSLGLHLLPQERLQELPADVQSLRTILNVATQCFPIVVAAASGNDSAGLTPPEGANIPAAWGIDPTLPASQALIGVAASSKTQDQACFSNSGEIGAPGGNGGVRPDHCEQLIVQCDEDCDYGVLSLSISSPSGYTYWNGSSFSTPLVSGQAALLLSNGLPSTQVKPCILNQSRGGQGISIANVEASLTNCLP